MGCTKYDILGVAQNADHFAIRAAYRTLAMKHHPDKGGDTCQFQKVQDAYETLGDEGARRQYDQQLHNPKRYVQFSRAGSEAGFSYDDGLFEDFIDFTFFAGRKDSIPQKRSWFFDTDMSDHEYQHHYEQDRAQRHRERESFAAAEREKRKAAKEQRKADVQKRQEEKPEKNHLKNQRKLLLKSFVKEARDLQPHQVDEFKIFLEEASTVQELEFLQTELDTKSSRKDIIEALRIQRPARKPRVPEDMSEFDQPNASQVREFTSETSPRQPKKQPKKKQHKPAKDGRQDIQHLPPPQERSAPVACPMAAQMFEHHAAENATPAQSSAHDAHHEILVQQQRLLESWQQKSTAPTTYREKEAHPPSKQKAGATRDEIAARALDIEQRRLAEAWKQKSALPATCHKKVSQPSMKHKASANYDEIISHLLDMGFEPSVCQEAVKRVLATGNGNCEAALGVALELSGLGGNSASSNSGGNSASSSSGGNSASSSSGGSSASPSSDARSSTSSSSFSFPHASASTMSESSKRSDNELTSQSGSDSHSHSGSAGTAERTPRPSELVGSNVLAMLTRKQPKPELSPPLLPQPPPPPLPQPDTVQPSETVGRNVLAMLARKQPKPELSPPLLPQPPPPPLPQPEPETLSSQRPKANKISMSEKRHPAAVITQSRCSQSNTMVGMATDPENVDLWSPAPHWHMGIEGDGDTQTYIQRGADEAGKLASYSVGDRVTASTMIVALGTGYLACEAGQNMILQYIGSTAEDEGWAYGTLDNALNSWGWVSLQQVAPALVPQGRTMPARKQVGVVSDSIRGGYTGQKSTHGDINDDTGLCFERYA